MVRIACIASRSSTRLPPPRLLGQLAEHLVEPAALDVDLVDREPACSTARQIGSRMSAPARGKREQLTEPSPRSLASTSTTPATPDDHGSRAARPDRRGRRERHRIVVARARARARRAWRRRRSARLAMMIARRADRVDLLQDVGRDDDRLVARPSRGSSWRTCASGWDRGRRSARPGSAPAGSCRIACARPTRRLKPLDSVSIGCCSTRSSSRRSTAASIRWRRSAPAKPRSVGDEAQEARGPSCRRRRARPRAGSRSAA